MGGVTFLSHWFSNPTVHSTYVTVRGIFIFLDIVLLIGFVLVFIESLKYRPNFYFHPPKQGERRTIKDPLAIKQWQSIITKSRSNPPQSLVLAIIDADKFVDDILKRSSIQGEHMADRLEKLSNWDLKSLDNLWKAHRIRNELVHQPDFNLTTTDAEDILNIYGNFLKEFGVL